jgi:hypothetical protein
MLDDVVVAAATLTLVANSDAPADDVVYDVVAFVDFSIGVVATCTPAPMVATAR